MSGKDALLQWCQKQTSQTKPGVVVENFSSSWSDGVALCTLVASIWPKSIDLAALPKSSEKKLDLALRIASDHGVPQLVEPSEFGSDEVEASLVMFISQLFEIFKTTRPPSQKLTKQQIRQSHQSHVINNLQYCAKCNNPLSLINVECGGKHYHTECFTCSLCDTKLTAQCIIIGGNPFCSTCGKKSFKMATWKLHKKEKEKWWQDVWRNSQQGTPPKKFDGWNKDGAEKRPGAQKETKEVGKLPQFEEDEEFIDSDDEKELSEAAKTKAEPNPAQPAAEEPLAAIQPDDDLLDQIDDEAEKRAFVELFSRLPEPELAPVQLGLSLVPSGGHPSRSSTFSSSAPTNAQDPASAKSRAHRSAMLIPAAAVPPPLPPKPTNVRANSQTALNGTTANTTSTSTPASAGATSASTNSNAATTNTTTATTTTNDTSKTPSAPSSPSTTTISSGATRPINRSGTNITVMFNNNVNITNNNVTNNNVVNNTIVMNSPSSPSPQHQRSRTEIRDSSRMSLPPALPTLSTRSVATAAIPSSPPHHDVLGTSTSTSVSPASSPQSSPRSSSPPNNRDSIYSNFSEFEAPPNASPEASPGMETVDLEPTRERGRFSRMFAASVSKLLLAEDPEDTEDPPIKEGFLVKKMDLGVVRPWQRRYFLLKRDQLMYFVNKESRMKGLTLGIIPLNSVKQINPISPAKWSRFELVGDNGMKWFLQADTRHEMLEWMHTLRKACKVKNEQKLHDLASSAGLSLKSLEKKEGTVDVKHKTTWVTRWIVLKDGILWAYATKDGPLKAKIPLYRCQLNEYQPPKGLVGQLMDWSTPTSAANSFFYFQITSPKRSIIVRTPSVEQMHAWLNAILKQKLIVEEIIENITLEHEVSP